MKIELSGEYNKTLYELLSNDSKLLEYVEETVRIFKKNPQDTRLKTHPLRKRLKGKWAMGIIGDETGDLRIIFEKLGKSKVRFLIIGPHIMVYLNKGRGG